MAETLTPQEKELLLKLARQSLSEGVGGTQPQPLDMAELPEALRQPGATFVTLTRRGELRGCVGTLEAYQQLAEDVREHALAAALADYRFPPVTPAELPELEIEISRLTQPTPLEYADGEDLLKRLRPGVDGVIIRDGPRRATFLPQVWEKLPDPQEFLSHLCYKMGADPGLWRRKPLEVLIYQVEEFHEQE